MRTAWTLPYLGRKTQKLVARRLVGRILVEMTTQEPKWSIRCHLTGESLSDLLDEVKTVAVVETHIVSKKDLNDLERKFKEEFCDGRR